MNHVKKVRLTWLRGGFGVAGSSKEHPRTLSTDVLHQARASRGGISMILWSLRVPVGLKSGNGLWRIRSLRRFKFGRTHRSQRAKDMETANVAENLDFSHSVR
jgi:hypothetical protein